MHVGLNLIYLVPGETGGMEAYGRELIAMLREHHPEVRLTAFVNSEAAEAGGPWDEIACVRVGVRARRRVEWVRGEQQLLPPLARRAGVDLLHSLASTAPAWGRFRRVVTIHDLHYKVLPEAHFGLNALGMRVLVPLAARTSDRVIAISHATASDVRRHLHVPEDRLDVVHQGVDHQPPATVTGEAELRSRYGLGDRAVALSASAKRPHKNIARLLDALALLEPATRPVLVIPGYRTAYEDELRRHAEHVGVTADVRFEGWIPAADLEGLYAIASVAPFPSLHEGFGLPVLEAMLRGVPVVCGDRSSLPEVAGDAALLVDCTDAAAIAAAMRRILGDAAEAERLRKAGRARAARFTWRATAEGTVAAYRAALGPAGPASSARRVG